MSDHSKSGRVNDDHEQILIKIPNSPYYVVEPPLYDFSSPDTIKDIKDSLFGPSSSTKPWPLLEPWRYELASQYNEAYNRENNVDVFAYLYDKSDDEM